MPLSVGAMGMSLVPAIARAWNESFLPSAVPVYVVMLPVVVVICPIVCVEDGLLY